MNEKEFEKLTRACDIVLKRFTTNDAIVAVSWLHVLNGHPNSTKQYQYALNKRNFFSTLQFVIFNFGYIIYKLGKSLFEPAINTSGLPHSIDILFISHLVNAELPKSNIDFYFGQLPHHAETVKNFRCITGMIDHTNGTKTKSQRDLIAQGNPIKKLFPKTLTVKKELKLIGLCATSFVSLLKAAAKETDKDLQTVLREAALQAIAPDTFYTLRIAENISALIQSTNPANLVITWEGRAWERMAVCQARKSNAKCIGYQHTVLLASSHSVKRSMGHAYDPDCILTVGNITKEILQQSGEFKQTTFNSFGSHRLVPSGGSTFNRLSKTICLVTPEGIESECLLLFDFAISMAVTMPDVQFIVRTHPVLPFAVLAEKYHRFLVLPNNCIVSDLVSINEDFERSNYILYRGSSVAMYAVLNGLKPVYYGLPDEISIDPLYLLGNWRSTVQSKNDFSTLIITDKKMAETDKEKQYKEAIDFCCKYVTQPNEPVFFNNLFSHS